LQWIGQNNTRLQITGDVGAGSNYFGAPYSLLITNGTAIQVTTESYSEPVIIHADGHEVFTSANTPYDNPP